VYGVDAALSPVALLLARGADNGIIELLALIPLLGLLAWLAQERHHRIRGVMELNEAYRGMAMVLGDVIENDDSYTSLHSREVVELAAQVGRQLGLTPQELGHLDTAALLHDVGKIALPKEIINKPGQLTPEEFEIVQSHTVIGQQMLDRVGGSMREVGLIVRSHHERWDGLGYPDGLRGESIPLPSRIIACCDAWNAMRTDRVYRAALSVEQALQELCANAGHQFDPQIAEIVTGIVTQAVSAPLDMPDRPVAQPASPQALVTS
jgi:putative nucleotidyltransferase with HDIG domain